MLHPLLDGLIFRFNLCGAVGMINYDRFLPGIEIDPHYHWAMLPTLVCPNTQHTSSIIIGLSVPATLL